MEEILDKMETAIINPEPNSKSDYESLYKNWGKLSKQEERRRELLEVQKCQRNNKIDKFRGILELVHAVEENNIFREDRRVHYRPTIYVAGFNKVNFSYNNVLMMSEWMIEKPQDLEENWYVTACPKGVRMLVVANQGKTKCFTKYGQFKFQMNSCLPGGNGNNNRGKNSCCVLDCFYQEKNNAMYVIDLLAWNNQPMTDCDTEFRDFWLRSQFNEIPQLGVVSKGNKVKFVLLPKVPCTKENLDTFMMKYPQFENDVPSLDGLLFYHKRAHYMSGQTPLVGWLFPYMVPEVLGADITVHELYLELKPKDYVDQATFIKSFDEKLAKKSNWHRRASRRNSTTMDTSEVKSETETNPAVVTNGAGDATTPEMEADASPDTTEKGAGDIKTPEMEAEEIPDTTVQGSGELKTPEMESEELPDSTVKESGETKAPDMEAEELPEKELMETAIGKTEPSK
ncbi:hypothetical protein ABMA28_007114 [Loxostege sticticalis]|uniref:Snurportin-1 n=1 Tax=Loxostege sticticalis TaxID=481309 RepID=A0ABD0TPM3_LOXSC